jgi:hypothetical protein
MSRPLRGSAVASLALLLALGVAAGRARAAEPGDGPSEGSVGWEPPSCDDVDVSLENLPPGSDTAAWSQLLAAAQAALPAAAGRLSRVDGDYARSLRHEKTRGQERADILKEREQARAEYAKARCRLPLLVERARRAGVAAEVWRSYPADLP